MKEFPMPSDETPLHAPAFDPPRPVEPPKKRTPRKRASKKQAAVAPTPDETPQTAVDTENTTDNS